MKEKDIEEFINRISRENKLGWTVKKVLFEIEGDLIFIKIKRGMQGGHIIFRRPLSYFKELKDNGLNLIYTFKDVKDIFSYDFDME